MSEQLDTLIGSANPVTGAGAVPEDAWSADRTWSEVLERTADERDTVVPFWRRPGFAVAAAVVLLVVALGTLVVVRDPDTEPTIDSTVPAPTTTTPSTTVSPTTSTTTSTSTSTTAPPTTVSAEEAAWLEIPTWGTSNGEAGTYRSSVFTPRLTLDMEEGWGRLPGASELANAVTPMVPPGSSPEVFAGIAIYRHGPPALEGEETASEVLARVEAHPSVEVLGTEEVDVGGLPATRIDFDLTGGMAYIQMNQQVAFTLPPGARVSSFVVDVGDETVSIIAFAPDPDSHTALMESVLPVVDSIEWTDI